MRQLFRTVVQVVACAVIMALSKVFEWASYFQWRRGIVFVVVAAIVLATVGFSGDDSGAVRATDSEVKKLQ